MEKVDVKRRKKIDRDILAVYWDNKGEIFGGYADIYDDGTAIIECKNGGHNVRQAGHWLKFAEYKTLNTTIVQRAVKIAKERYGK
jgi:hypothetical protein